MSPTRFLFEANFTLVSIKYRKKLLQGDISLKTDGRMLINTNFDADF